MLFTALAPRLFFLLLLFFRNFGYNHVKIRVRSTGQAVLGLFIVSGFGHSFWSWVNLIKLQYIL